MLTLVQQQHSFFQLVSSLGEKGGRLLLSPLTSSLMIWIRSRFCKEIDLETERSKHGQNLRPQTTRLQPKIVVSCLVYYPTKFEFSRLINRDFLFQKRPILSSPFYFPQAITMSIALVLTCKLRLTLALSTKLHWYTPSKRHFESQMQAVWY